MTGDAFDAAERDINNRAYAIAIACKAFEAVVEAVGKADAFELWDRIPDDYIDGE